MAKIGKEQFRIMCNMWGVDHAIRAAKNMGMTPSKEQIEECQRLEEEQNKRWHDVFSKMQEEEEK